jgi:hypothetical protein
MRRLTVTDTLIHITATRTAQGDVHVAGAVIVADAGEHPDADVIDGRGAATVPLYAETVLAPPFSADAAAFDLVPGNPATFAVIKGAVRSEQIRHMLVVSPRALRAVVVDGTLVARDGEPIRAAGADALAAEDPRLGAWTDAGRDMTQFLTRDGRYSETRGGRRDAYTGRFWLDGDRITYLDDTGFWAFGQYVGGVLHHAGFVLRRDAAASAHP